MRTGDFRRSFVEGPSEETLNGPVLTDVPYPQVLVVRAFSHGDDLELVLHPGEGASVQQIKIARLKPGQSYTVEGANEATVTADENGEAHLNVALNGRTAIDIRPS